MRKLLIAGFGVALAALLPSAFGSTASIRALDCPVAGLATACGAADLVISTVCNPALPEVPTVGPVTIDVDGGGILVCPELPV